MKCMPVAWSGCRVQLLIRPESCLRKLTNDDLDGSRTELDLNKLPAQSWQKGPLRCMSPDQKAPRPARGVRHAPRVANRSVALQMPIDDGCGGACYWFGFGRPLIHSHRGVVDALAVRSTSMRA